MMLLLFAGGVNVFSIESEVRVNCLGLVSNPKGLIDFHHSDIENRRHRYSQEHVHIDAILIF